ASELDLPLRNRVSSVFLYRRGPLLLESIRPALRPIPRAYASSQWYFSKNPPVAGSLSCLVATYQYRDRHHGAGLAATAAAKPQSHGKLGCARTPQLSLCLPYFCSASRSGPCASPVVADASCGRSVYMSTLVVAPGAVAGWAASRPM